MNIQTRQALIETAVNMRDAAYCPYSNYQVGAAILTASGAIYGGCNIENASYPATICAERTAAVKAVSDGQKDFRAVAIAVSGKTPGYPCGVCRQFMNEFVENDMEVILINKDGEITEETFSAIFPHGFKGEDMNA